MRKSFQAFGRFMFWAGWRAGLAMEPDRTDRNYIARQALEVAEVEWRKGRDELTGREKLARVNAMAHHPSVGQPPFVKGEPLPPHDRFYPHPENV